MHDAVKPGESRLSAENRAQRRRDVAETLKKFPKFVREQERQARSRQRDIRRFDKLCKQLIEMGYGDKQALAERLLAKRKENEAKAKELTPSGEPQS